jgi:DNA invertase Pin-like site-specific DNA recombinase
VAGQKQDRKVRAIGYSRCSTGEQATNGYSLDAQEDAITARAQARGWNLLEVRSDPGVSGAVPADQRPALSKVLAKLDAGEADVLIVGRLDRLSRSMADLVTLLDRARRNEWVPVFVDGASGLDLSSTEGKLFALMLGGFAEIERELISRRTKEGLAEARRRGVRLGRPPTLPDDVISRIITARDSGDTWQAICDTLTADQVPTARGGIWRPGTVSYLYRTHTSGPPKRGVRRAERAAFLQEAGAFS